jgi:hypothetical protein
MNEKTAKAADDIETLAIYMKDLVRELREEGDNQVAYAKLYYLRQDLGRIVGRFGAGVPSRTRTTVRPLNLVDNR